MAKDENSAMKQNKGEYLVTPVGDKMRTVKETDVNNRSGVGQSNPRDEMFTSGAGRDSEPERPWLRIQDGNILEAKGRDVSNSSGDVDPNGWGGDDAPYKGMAIEASYGMGAGGPNATRNAGPKRGSD